MESKAKLYIIITVFLLILIFSAFLFVNCMRYYLEFDVIYADFAFAELTFRKYEEVSVGKGGYRYDIYFDEYTEPFEISNITGKRLDKRSLYRLSENEILAVYYREKASDDDTRSICEMKSDDTVFLSLSDYKTVNQNNQIIGMICCVAFFLTALGCLVHIIKKFKDDGF